MVTVNIRIENREVQMWFKVGQHEEGLNLTGAKMFHTQLGERIQQAEEIVKALGGTED